MSPEQVGGEEASASSDLFAAVVISAELFLLRRLLDEGSPEKTLHHLQRYDSQALDLKALPPALADTVRKGLSTAREDRYANADEFSRAVCVAVPSSAGRTDLESFWDALFPDSLGEEDTVVAACFPGRGLDILRENREGYGGRRGDLVKISVLTALAALSFGGWAAWKMTTPSTFTRRCFSRLTPASYGHQSQGRAKRISSSVGKGVIGHAASGAACSLPRYAL
jgi:hypothetical protein